MVRSYGPTPSKGAQRGWWMQRRATPLNGLYPRDLYYSNSNDREILRNGFYNLVIAKCLIYQGNHRNYRVAPNLQPAAAPEQPGANRTDWPDSSEAEKAGDEDDMDYSTTGTASARPRLRKKRAPASGTAGEPNLTDLTSDTITSLSTSFIADEIVVRGRAKDTQAATVTPRPARVDSNKRCRSYSLQRGKKRARKNCGAPTLMFTLKFVAQKVLSGMAQSGLASFESPRRPSLGRSTASALPSIGGSNSSVKSLHLRKAPSPTARARSEATGQPHTRTPTPSSQALEAMTGEAGDELAAAKSASSGPGELTGRTAAIRLLTAGSMTATLTAARPATTGPTTIAPTTAKSTVAVGSSVALPTTHIVRPTEEMTQRIGQHSEDISRIGDRAPGSTLQFEDGITKQVRTAAPSHIGHVEDLVDYTTSGNTTAPSPAAAISTTPLAVPQQLDSSAVSGGAVMSLADQAEDAAVQTSSRSTNAPSPIAATSTMPPAAIQQLGGFNVSGDAAQGNVGRAEAADQTSSRSTSAPSAIAATSTIPTAAFQQLATLPAADEATQSDSHANQSVPQPCTGSVGLASMTQPQSMSSIPGLATPLPSDGGTVSDVLERTEVEVDWSHADEYPSFIQLEACRAVQDFFTKIDEQLPTALQDRPMKSISIEHVNALVNGRDVSCRIVRHGGAGFAAFRTLLRRLRQLDDGAYPELRVSVEWA
ncbi:hypothetical protein LTR36_000623 [Oleoguttula mirabilis]|uniref:Uncharacterized protein n=1 Tax=Oleoguttula mirabilis TaxID=1507867 RepID=A0AAV9JQ04_9PEZI|nr:hypothetical protein LTR36_000623 [Oleoguttula mirabilis]